MTTEDSPSPALTHAGAVVWREAPSGTLFLLVSARGAANEWVLPKGHIEDEESPESAAEREVREESGLEVRVDEYLGTEAFRLKGAEAVCAYYLARYLRDGTPPAEGREIVWLGPDEAIERATFPAGVNMIERAKAALGRES